MQRTIEVQSDTIFKILEEVSSFSSFRKDQFYAFELQTREKLEKLMEDVAFLKR